MELIETMMLYGTLCCPILILVLRQLGILKIKSTYRLAIVSFFLVFALYVGAAQLLDLRLKAEMYSFDLDNDGSFSSSELTPAAEAAMENYTADTGRTFAPIVGFLYALLYTSLVFGLNKVGHSIYSRFSHNENT